ncbi:mask, partial [Symbiodinium sp. CCMP2456]
YAHRLSTIPVVITLSLIMPTTIALRFIWPSSMAPDRLRDLLQLARPGWRRKDVEAIEARLSRVGITTVSELQAAVLSKTLNQTLHRSQQKPFPAVTLRALTAVAEGLTESTGEMPRPDREGSKEEFPRLHGLSHVSRSPRWTFSLSSGENMRRLQPPGPGSYDPYIDASPDFASRHSKGPIFSFGLSSRDGMGKPKIPGPGAYELAKEAGSGASKWTITPRREKPGASAAGTAGAGTGTASAATTGGAAAPAAPVTGFGETPGPGDYEIEALLGKKSPKYSAGKKFDSGEAEKCPGPGDYWQAFGSLELGLWRCGLGLGVQCLGPPGFRVQASSQELWLCPRFQLPRSKPAPTSSSPQGPMPQSLSPTSSAQHSLSP